MNLTSLLALPQLEEDLGRLESTLRRSLRTEDALLADVAQHLVSAGGKRLRPALTIAAAASGRAPATEEVLLGGVSVELVHLASLYHDDVMDEATTRRSVQTVNSRWGNLVAIVAGDFLLARSAEIAAGLGTEVAGLLAVTLGRLCEGQISEVHSAFDMSRSEEAYLSAIAGKTASLMAASCRIGALTAGLDRHHIEALTTFGQCFGMAFQIRDDILDVVATHEDLGKEPGQDLVAGIYTMPVLRALRDSESQAELKELLGKPLSPQDRDIARDIVASSGAIAETTRTGRRYAERAAGAVTTLADTAVGESLARLGRSLIDTLPGG
ncbi:MAG: polyprenyl synthetase family protein [Acidimicrobiales bacterium]